jgi:hypothetical protein
MSNEFEEKYNSIVQILCHLIDPTFLIVELGRGSGKSTEIAGERIVNMAQDLSYVGSDGKRVGATIGLAADTYMSLWQNILPSILQYLRTYYHEGHHFVVGKIPPDHFGRPLIPVYDYKHTISTVWGTVFQLISADRPESALSKNFACVVCDELLRIDKERFQNRIFKAVRGNRDKFGFSRYFGGFTGLSSTPDPELDETWWLEYEKQMDPEKIKKILYIAWRVNEALYKFHSSESDFQKNKALNFINKWTPRLNDLRRNQLFYLRASSFSNIKILGWDYIKNQITGTTDFDIIKTALLSIRTDRVKLMFFGKFTKKNTYNDSYIYRKNAAGDYIIDTYSLNEKPDKTSLDLTYCDKNKPLIAGVDWGGFMSMVVAQYRAGIKRKEFRIFKNFFVWHPEQHAELAEKFVKFFHYHSKKELILHYDRAGNQRKYDKNKTGNSAETDAKMFKIELEKLGWSVKLVSISQRVIYHWEHYKLDNMLLEGKLQSIPEIYICQNECEELISSLKHSPLKKSEGQIELDKTSEKNLPYEQQAALSTQLATSMTYLLFGEFEKYLIKSKIEVSDYDTMIS